MPDPKPPMIPDSYKASLPSGPKAQAELQLFLTDIMAGNLQVLNGQMAKQNELLAAIAGLLEEIKGKKRILIPGEDTL